MSSQGDIALSEKFDLEVPNEEEMDIEQKFNNDIFGEVEFIKTECLIKYSIELDPNLIFNRLEECNGHPDRVAQVLDRFRPHVPKDRTSAVPVLDLTDNDIFDEEISIADQAFLMDAIITDFHNTGKNNGDASRKRRLSPPKSEEDLISSKKMQTSELEVGNPGPSGLQQQTAEIILEKASRSDLPQRVAQINLENPSSSDLQHLMTPSDTERAGPSGLQQQAQLYTEKAGPSGLQQHLAPIVLENSAPSLQQFFAQLNPETFNPSDAQLPLTPTEEEEAGPLQLKIDLLPEIINSLTESLPDADIEYLTFLASEFQDPLELNAKVELLLESKNYPKKKDKLEEERMKRIRAYYTERVFSPQDVSKWHDEPLGYFNDTQRNVSELYKQHAIMQTYIDFPKLTAAIIKTTLHNNNFHYFPTFCHLRQFDNNPRTPTHYKRKTKRKPEPLPQAADEDFYKELAFAKISDEYIFFLVEKNEKRELQLEHARLYNDWVECQCCFEDQVLFEEAEQCIEGVHLFCRNCVRKLAEEAAVNNSNELKCVASDCKSTFSLQTIERVLKPIVYEKWLQRCQAEEVKNANIDDFVTCPYCDYGAIIENPEEKVFRCMNPSCGKETCRLCKEESHIPLRCNEVEKASQRKARTYVEEEMANALIRTCPKCQIKFVKEVIGCNKMVCKCGQAMCYLCRQPIKDYNHFAPDRCPLYVDTNKLHEDEVHTREEKAKQAQRENEDNPNENVENL